MEVDNLNLFTTGGPIPTLEFIISLHAMSPPSKVDT